MWYFAWILGVLMACFASVMAALYMENHQEFSDAAQHDDVADNER